MKHFFSRLFPLISSLSVPVLAHPHVWIDVEISPQTNAQGEIIALREQWEFDPLYAQMLLESVRDPRNAANAPALWQYVQSHLLTELSAENFYTNADSPLLSPTTSDLKQENNQLFLNVILPLKQPTKTLQYQIYEKQYFIEILHSQKQQTTFASGCTLRITPASPSSEHIRQAAALDRNEKSPEPLGQFFAETGEITCS